MTPDHVATENRLLSGLSAEQREQLAGLLRQLLVSFEGSTSDDTFPHLGLALAPAHTTIEIRRSVGLPELAGLLVRAVEPGSRAERADIRTGDVLVRAGERELRSVTSLYAAIADAQPSDRLSLSAVRGVDTKVEAVLDLCPDPADEVPPGRTSPGGDPATHTL